MMMQDQQVITALPVMEQFYTLQGEGFHQGRAAYFIRLAGCDIGCVWCDVKESWDADQHPKMLINDIVSEVKKTPAEVVVITGGEPAMHDLTELTKQLKEAGFKTHIETSGAYELSGTWDWICVSPKKFKAPLPTVLSQANELKVVVFNRSDLKWADANALLVPATCKLYLQPEWERAREMTPLIIDHVKAFPRWELSLQIHKFINIP